jgi:hypothetical protein
MLDRRNFESMCSLIFFDRYVLTHDEFLVTEPIAGFVSFIAMDVVVKCPSTAGSVNQVTDILIAGAEAHDAAFVAMFMPKLCVDASSFIQRRDENISVASAP